MRAPVSSKGSPKDSSKDPLEFLLKPHPRQLKLLNLLRMLLVRVDEVATAVAFRLFLKNLDLEHGSDWRELQRCGPESMSGCMYYM